MTRFYLMRHGNRALTIGDPALSPHGIAQAQATARRLSDKAIAAVYASPLRRARETAEWIARAQRLEVMTDVRLRERMNWGDVPSQSFDEFIALWAHCTHERDFVPTVGDSARGAGQRIESFVHEMTARYPQGEVVAVLHGGVLADFLVNVFSEAELNRWHPDFIAQQSQLAPECSITMVRYDGVRCTLECFADVQHLHNVSC